MDGHEPSLVCPWKARFVDKLLVTLKMMACCCWKLPLDGAWVAAMALSTVLTIVAFSIFVSHGLHCTTDDAEIKDVCFANHPATSFMFLLAIQSLCTTPATHTRLHALFKNVICSLARSHSPLCSVDVVVRRIGGSMG